MRHYHLHTKKLHVHVHDDFEESDHPRGQPNNPGQFAKKGEASVSSKGEEKVQHGHKSPANQEKLIKSLPLREREMLDNWVTEDPVEYKKLQRSPEFADMIRTKLPQYHGPMLRGFVMPRVEARQLKNKIGKTITFAKNTPVAIGNSTKKDVAFFTGWKKSTDDKAIIYKMEAASSADIGFDEADGLHEGVVPMGTKFKIAAVNLVLTTDELPGHYEVVLKEYTIKADQSQKK